jgi:hypothetical protein
VEERYLCGTGAKLLLLHNIKLEKYSRHLWVTLLSRDLLEKPLIAQKLMNILSNSNVYCHINTSSPLVPVLIQINPVHSTHPISLGWIRILSSQLYLGLPIWLFAHGFPIKSYMQSSSSPYVPHALLIASCLTYKLWSSSLCNFLKSPIILSPQHPILKHSYTAYSSVTGTDQVSYPYKTTGDILVL